MMKKTAVLAALGLVAAGTVAIAAPDTQGAHRHHGQAMLERIKAADANADGLLSRTEAAALPRLAARFDRLDANQDGQVSFEELRAGRKGHRQGFLQRADADGDGRLSKAEVVAQAEAHFERMDADKDGFLSAGEMPRRHGHKHRHGGAGTR